jgi:L-alanine-DL-glutamate epimerase-like enolase superfamily enzyme
VYASGIDTPLTDDELVAYYRRMASLGVGAGKLKVGRDRIADSRRLHLMANALQSLGKYPQLIVDANEFWSPKQAVQRISELERDFELVWVEEPVRRWDHQGLRRVSDAIRAPVATGENLSAVNEFVPLVVNGAVDVIQIAASTSGITGALRVAELASAFDLPVSMMNCPGRFMGHVAAALPHHTMMEVLDAGRDAVLVHQPPIENGELLLGSEPGSGIEFHPDRLAAAHEAYGRAAIPPHEVYRRAEDAGLVGG